MTPIERIARAIVARRNLPEGSLINWPSFLADAETALIAMREPAPEMIAAVREIGGSQWVANTRAVWSTMIDAALREGAP